MEIKLIHHQNVRSGLLSFETAANRGILAAATALNDFAYNFIKIHRSLRMSPTMAAGVTESALERRRFGCPFGFLKLEGGGKSGVNETSIGGSEWDRSVFAVRSEFDGSIQIDFLLSAERSESAARLNHLAHRNGISGGSLLRWRIHSSLMG